MFFYKQYLTNEAFLGGGGGGGGIIGAVYGHWLYSRMFLHNFGSVFQFACPSLLVFELDGFKHIITLE